MHGQLFLIPSSLGDNTIHTIPPHTQAVAHALRHFIAERAKTARHFLKALGTPVPFGEMTFFELNKQTPLTEVEAFLQPALAGHDIGLLSEAGCPGVADPGAVAVAAAHRLGIRVVPLVGPSSILLSLMASGLNGQNFAFQGYLGVKKPDRIRDLKRLEGLALRHQQTQIFIETPYRNTALIEDALAALAPATRFCIAANLTLPNEYIETHTIQEWRTRSLPDLHKQPTIFLIGK